METLEPEERKTVKERPLDDFTIGVVESHKYVQKEVNRHKGVLNHPTCIMTAEDTIAAFALKNRHLTELNQLFAEDVTQEGGEETIVAEPATDMQAPKRGMRSLLCSLLHFTCTNFVPRKESW